MLHVVFTPHWFHFESVRFQLFKSLAGWAGARSSAARCSGDSRESTSAFNLDAFWYRRLQVPFLLIELAITQAPKEDARQSSCLDFKEAGRALEDKPHDWPKGGSEKRSAPPHVSHPPVSKTDGVDPGSKLLHSPQAGSAQRLWGGPKGKPWHAELHSHATTLRYPQVIPTGLVPRWKPDTNPLPFQGQGWSGAAGGAASDMQNSKDPKTLFSSP